jgi:hypothetical protein
MIDFVSTHPDADPQTIACARLLAAVIAQAVDDASNRQATALEQDTAVGWLFDKTSTFEQYAGLIGVDPSALRMALLEPVDDTKVEPKNSKFDSSRRRNFRVSYTRWLARRNAEQAVLRKVMGVA